MIRALHPAGAFLMLALGVISVLGKQEPFYLGTYTGHSASKGIYRGTLDEETGKLSLLSLAASATDPSFLAFSPNGRFVYAAGENPDTGTVRAFRHGDDGGLSPLNSQAFKGNGTCHVSVDSTGRYLLAANYGSGSIACFQLQPDGSIGDRTALVPFTGSGPNAQRQESSHAHAVYFSPDDAFVYACDLGADHIWILKFDATTGALTANDPPSAQVPSGSGPRHLAFNHTGDFVYVANELEDSVTVFSRNPRTGNLTELETVSLLSAGTPPGKALAAEIVLHPSGKWLYVSNRGRDTVSVLAIDPSGHLKLIQNAAASVKSPRSFTIDPSGRWMIIAGMQDNRIAVLKINPRSGELSTTPQSIEVASPVCVLFATKPPVDVR